tara:strand:- start:187 stop:1407 length:1221 start_codon:yes stop_codon:yes gene_type:complete
MAVLGAGGGGGGGQVIEEHILIASQTFVPPRNGKVNIIVVGGGGAGAHRFGANIGGFAAGGGAGGYCEYRDLDVTTSGSFTVVVGAGGASTYSGGNTNGAAGGQSTVAGTGLSATLTANGGSGGVNGASTDVIDGGAGGTAANGTVNRTGGAGGGIPNANSLSAVCSMAAGGGAVAINSAVGYAGGSVVSTSGAYGANKYLACGGAGIGGRGGSLNGGSPYGATTYGGQGGHNAGPGQDFPTTQAAAQTWGPGFESDGGKWMNQQYAGVRLDGRPIGHVGFQGEDPAHYIVQPGIADSINPQSAWNNYSNMKTNQFHAPMGVGGGGGVPTDHTASTWALSGGAAGTAFGGGGGTVCKTPASYTQMRIGDGGLGGGGGGIRQQHSSNYCLNGAGGDGVVIIRYTSFT